MRSDLIASFFYREVRGEDYLPGVCATPPDIAKYLLNGKRQHQPLPGGEGHINLQKTASSYPPYRVQKGHVSPDVYPGVHR